MVINADLQDLEDFSYSVKFTYLIAYCGWFQFFLNKWDRASMSNSIEVRMPFLDPNVRLFSLALNADNKIRNGMSKSILRDAFKDHFPKSILNQNFKQGLTQHKFDFENQKYKKFIQEILNEKNYVYTSTWTQFLRRFMKKIIILLLWAICSLSAQVGPAKELHRNPPRAWALTNAIVHSAAGKTI